LIVHVNEVVLFAVTDCALLVVGSPVAVSPEGTLNEYEVVTSAAEEPVTDIISVRLWLRFSCAADGDAEVVSVEGSIALTMIPDPLMLPALVVAVGVKV